jgi:ABC-type Mn2+/Zn2+ transport system ATPase subunit
MFQFKGLYSESTMRKLLVLYATFDIQMMIEQFNTFICIVSDMCYSFNWIRSRNSDFVYLLM